MTKGMSVVVVSLALATLGGCKNKCVTLEERVCSDLGAADCALWRERGGAEAARLAVRCSTNTRRSSRARNKWSSRSRLGTPP
jgi:hypothetical protein